MLVGGVLFGSTGGYEAMKKIVRNATIVLLMVGAVALASLLACDSGPTPPVTSVEVERVFADLSFQEMTNLSKDLRASLSEIAEIKNIQLGIDKQTKNIYNLIQTQDNGTKITITVNSFKTNQPIPQSLFEFKESRYKDFYINRLD